MAVETLVDERGYACLYCTTSGWAFGPVFHGFDAADKAEAWAAWFASGGARRAIIDNGLKVKTAFGRYDDPREYDQLDLERLLPIWSKEHIDSEGDLVATKEEA